MTAQSHDVVVIGGGLAGLNAARILHRIGYDVVLVERLASVGGRVRTDVVDGFRLDHGFQLYNPAYPAGRRSFDHDRLDLQPFAAGVEVLGKGGWTRLQDPARDRASAPGTALAALGGRVAPPWELAAFGAYAAACAAEPVARLRQRPDVTIADALRTWGVGRRAIGRLIGPFLSGVFADVDLATSRRYADLVLRSFVRGTPALPAAGMQALPDQFAADLPAEAVRTDTEVLGIADRTVTTTQGALRGRVVIVAADPATAAALLPGLAVPAMSALTTWYFAAQQAPPHGRRLLVVGSSLLCNVAVVTSAAPTYSATGRALIAATAVGHHPDEETARHARVAAAALVGSTPGELTEIGRYAIRDALPVFSVGTPLQRRVELGGGVLLIGDHRQTPSIQGALVSGERGASAAARLLGFR